MQAHSVTVHLSPAHFKCSRAPRLCAERPWQPCSWQNADLSAIFTQIRQFVTCNELCEVTARQIRRRSQQSSSNGTAPGEQAQLSEQLSSRGARGGMGRRFGSAGPENDARAAVRQHSSARSALEAQNCSGVGIGLHNT